MLLTASFVVFTSTCLKLKFIYAFKTCTGRKLYRTSKITEKFSQSLQFRNLECGKVAEHSLRICVIVTSPFMFLPTFGKGHCPFRFRSATACPRRCKGRPLSVVIIFTTTLRSSIHIMFMFIVSPPHAMSTQETRCLDPNANNVTLTKRGGGPSMGKYSQHNSCLLSPRGILVDATLAHARTSCRRLCHKMKFS